MSKAEDNAIILDTILDDKDYDKVSFSNKDDIMEFLENYDIIYNQAKSNGGSPLCVIEDFSSLIYDRKKKVCPMIIEYILIKIGKLQVDTKGKVCETIIEELAISNNKRIKTINRILDEEIELVIDRNKDRWKKTIEKKYGTSNFSDCSLKGGKRIKTEKDIEFEQSLWDLDYEIKYGKKRMSESVESVPQTNEDYPQELLDLELIYESNQTKLNELRQIKERDKDEQKEMSRLIKASTSLLDDIRCIKDYYGIRYEQSTKVESYGDYNALEFNDITNCMEYKTLGKSDFDLEADEIKLSKIKEIADEALTDKQYVLFDLYFFQGLKQKEIANLVGDNQSTVSRNINSLITKLKQRLVEM